MPASPRRLAWMIRNADRLAPRDGREWQRYDLVINHPERERWLQQLDDGLCCGVPRILILEGSTCCDCLIEAERAFIWIEGKRFDWIDPARKWDITRDQLARNAEAAMILADQAKKDFYLIICHEGRLKHHEEALITGYRNQTWRAGLPHLTDEERQRISQRIGTLTWQQIAEAWNIDLPR